jgi:uncharacterized membrane protein
MNKTALLSVAGALAGAVAMVQAAVPAQAAAGVKCYGIAAAGHNDCGNKAAGHYCAGQSTVAYDGTDFKTVKSKAACTEQAGKLKPFEGQNPQKT